LAFDVWKNYFSSANQALFSVGCSKKIPMFRVFPLLVCVLSGAIFLTSCRREQPALAFIPESSGMVLDLQQPGAELWQEEKDLYWATFFESEPFLMLAAEHRTYLKWLLEAGWPQPARVQVALDHSTTRQSAPLWIYHFQTPVEAEALIQQAPYQTHRFQGQNLYRLTLPQGAITVASSGCFLLISTEGYRVEDALSASHSPLKAPEADPHAVRTLYLHHAWLYAYLQMDTHLLPPTLVSTPDWYVLSRRADGKFLGKIKENSALGATQPDALAAIIPGDVASVFWAPVQDPDLASDDLRRYVRDWIGEEMAWVSLPYHIGGNQHCVVWPVRDSAVCDRQLEALIQHKGVRQQIDFQTFTLVQLEGRPDFAAAGMQDTCWQYPVLLRFPHQVVLAPEMAALQYWVEQYIVNQTLLQSATYLSLRAGVPLGGRLMTYVQKKQGTLLTAIAPETAGGNQLSWQWAEGQNTGKRVASARWRQSLGSPALTPPFLVQLPISGHRILVQSADFILHCFTPEGQLCWRHPLPAAILSDVYSLPGESGALPGILFNTAQSVHLLDENGMDQQGFPLRLASEASNGLVLVSSATRQRSTFYLACMNSKVYGFDALGRPLNGWNAVAVDAPLRQSFCYWKKGPEEYLAACSASGRMYAWDMQGEARPLPPEGAGQWVQLWSDTSGHKTGPTWWGLRNDRSLWRITAGQAQVAALVAERVDHFACTGARCWIQSGSQVETREARSGNVLYKNRIKAPVQQVFPLPGDRLGLLASEGLRLYMLEANGMPSLSMPLSGSKPFLVCRFNGLFSYLLICDDEYIKLYNYM
jgi:hypothetical protein